MNNVAVQVSPKQMSKLRNGKKVRVKPVIEGQGICLIVNPGNYNLLSRSFNKGKGAEIMLSPEEVMMNKEAAPNMEGQGIFGKKFDRGVKKLIGRPAQKALYAVARENLPYAQGALTAGLTAGATALGVAQPELIPFLPFGVASLSALGSDYLENPAKYQGRKSSTLAKEYAKNQAIQKLNQQLGTNMDNLTRASIGSALANKMSADLLDPTSKAYSDSTLDGIFGSGLYAGASKNGGAVGVTGNFITPLPPAMQSQPYSANFQFQSTLPPAYQWLKKGSGLYA